MKIKIFGLSLLLIICLMLAMGCGNMNASGGGGTSTAKGNITGKVVAAGSGQALCGATVVCGSITTTTGTGGSYSLNDINVGTRTVEASFTGYISGNTTVTVTDGQTTVAATIELTSTATTGAIFGTVLNPIGGNPISGMDITLEGSAQTSCSSSNGTFEISGLTPGSYVVHAFQSHGQDFSPTKETVTVIAGQTVDVTLYMELVTHNFNFYSSAFPDNGTIEVRYASSLMGGSGESIPLQWEYAPQQTQSFAFMMLDLNNNNFVHWLIKNIPASAGQIVGGASPDGLPSGCVELTNNRNRTKYYGMSSPEAHLYDFRLYALNTADVAVVIDIGSSETICNQFERQVGPYLVIEGPKGFLGRFPY